MKTCQQHLFFTPFHNRRYTCQRIGLYFFIITLVLSYVLPNLLSAQNEIAGMVNAGSTDNRFMLEINNPGAQTPVDGLALTVGKTGKWITNVFIKADGDGPLAPGTSRKYTILFDVKESAQPGDTDTLILNVSSDIGLIDNPNPKMTVQITERKVTKPVVTVCALKEGAKFVPVEDARHYCDPDVDGVNEYDNIMIFITPGRGLHTPYQEEYLYKVKNANGKVVRQGNLIKPESGNERTGIQQAGSSGEFAVELDLWSDRRLASDPEERGPIPGTYIVETKGKSETKWQEAGRFDVQDGRIHFAGFITEPVNKLGMPQTGWRYNGEANIKNVYVNVNNGKVDLEIDAWQQSKIRRNNGLDTPGAVLRGNSHLTMVFPRAIRPGKVIKKFDSLGISQYPLEPVAEIDINWTADGDDKSVYIPVFLHPTATLPPPSRQVSREGWGGRTVMDQSLNSDKALSGKAWKPAKNSKCVYRVGICDRDPFGDPSRALSRQLHDAETLWVIPVIFKLSSTSSSDVDIYGYGLYRRSPGEYHGPLPKAPPWGKAGQGQIEKVPDLKGFALGEAKSRLKEKGFTSSHSAGKPAPSDELAFTVASQNPPSGTLLPKGETVELELYGPVGKVSVPDLTGFTLRAAKSRLEEKGLESVQSAGESAPSENKAYTIASQYPAPDTMLKKGDTVELVIFGPVARVTVPDLTGLSLRAAKARLKEIGLSSSQSAGRAAPSKRQEYTIASQEPPPGTTLKKGINVDLVIFGPAKSGVIIPDVAGLSSDDARQRLRNKGLTARTHTIGAADSRAWSGKVKLQEPAAGTNVSPGSEVEIWVYGKYTPTKEERVAQTDCSRYPGSRAYWNNDEGKPMCGCFDGQMWNLAKTRCVSQQEHDNEVCARDFPGCIANGRDSDGSINCVCRNGYTWSKSKHRCVKKSSGGGGGGGQNIPNQKERECGYLIMRIKMAVIGHQTQKSAFTKQMLDQAVQEARNAGCNQSAIQEASGGAGSAGGGGSNAGGGWEEEECECVDENGRRYHEPLGQDCGFGPDYMREYCD